MSQLLEETLQRLNEITQDCREDMHEPDEQNVSAVLSGYRLDNAMGNDPLHNYGEMTIGIKVKHDYYEGHDEELEWFNLATLIALARKAKL